MNTLPSFRTALVLTLSLSLSLCYVSSAQAAGKVTRASSERSTGGLTPEEYWDQTLQLHEWLMSELPIGTLDKPIRIPLTRQDRKAIANDRTPFPRPLRVGIVKRVGRTIELWRGGRIPKASARLPNGAFRRTDDGGFTWAVAFESEGASALRVQLSDVSLPDSADVYFFSLDGQAHGPYRGRDTFWTNSVMGSQGIVLVRQFGPPAAGTRAMSISVASVGNIAEQFANAEPLLCDNNAECTENAEDYNHNYGYDWLVSDLMAATARLRWVQGAWMYSCSGGLLADTIGSQIPYFLTANHCLKSNAAARSLELFWNYTKSQDGCDGPDGPPTMGATVRATGVKGDFTLLELDQTPPAGSVFMGWNNAKIADTSGVKLHRVHHPGGAPQSYSEHLTDSGFQACGGLPIPQFIYSEDTLGTTEGGSSGSPVTNSYGEVVGQLYGGCGSNQDICFHPSWRTVDGAFAFYYDKVAQYLDPSCQPSPEICDDGSDNDCDTDTDCDDSECTEDPDCLPDACWPKNQACSIGAECCSGTCKPNGRCR